MSTTTRDATPRSSVLFVLGILLVAANLRPALISVGPVLPALRADLGLGATLAGVLTALPLLAFAAVALITPALARRLGAERALVLALALLVVGTAARSVGGTVLVFAATAVLAMGIGTANVLLPVLVRSAVPHQVGLVTSWYVATLTLVAAAAAGLAAPIAAATAGGWRTALGCWTALCLAALVAWLPAARRRAPQRAAPAGQAGRSANPGQAAASVWGSATAWAVAAFFGLQSTIFYSVIAWLPTVLLERGTSATSAGLYLLVYQVAGLLSGLALPLALRRRPDQKMVAAAAAAFSMVGCAGLALAQPGPWTWVWAVSGGIGSGALFTLALTLIALRAADAPAATALSAMAQSCGYLLAAAGPVAVGALHEASGGWTLPLLLLAAVAAAAGVAGLRAGAARTLPERQPGHHLHPGPGPTSTAVGS